MKNYNFLLLCTGLTGLYFIVTGIQYWISDYMITELEQSESVVFTSFGIVTITGPVLGVVVGGNIITRFGGYNTRKTLILTCATAIFCLGVAIPVPFVNNFPLFLTLLWFLLFFGGFMLPALTGIMLNTVE